MKTASQLRKFRQTCERSAGIPANRIQLPLLAVLEDVCQALKLSPQDRRWVLGRKGVTALKHTRQMQVRLTRPAKVIYYTREEGRNG